MRTETALGAHSISMAAAAQRLAQNLFGDLSRTHVLLIGVGEMVELAATYFAAQQPRSGSSTSEIARAEKRSAKASPRASVRLATTTACGRCATK